MTEHLHKLIDTGAAQPVINERVAGLIETAKNGLGDHEKRIRYLERTVSYALGLAGAISVVMYLVAEFKK